MNSILEVYLIYSAYAIIILNFMNRQDIESLLVAATVWAIAGRQAS